MVEVADNNSVPSLTVDYGAKLHIVGDQNEGMVNVTSDFGASTKVEQNMPPPCRSDLKACETSHAWNTGIKTEYKFNAGALEIIPHVEGRYLSLVIR